MRRWRGCVRSGWRIQGSGSFTFGGDADARDTPVALPGGGPYHSDMEARVAVLQGIARRTAAGLDSRLDAPEVQHRAEFHWL